MKKNNLKTARNTDLENDFSRIPIKHYKLVKLYLKNSVQKDKKTLN